MSLEAQDSPTTRTTCRILILLFIVISVQANKDDLMIGTVFIVGLSWASNDITFGLKKLHLAVRALP